MLIYQRFKSFEGAVSGLFSLIDYNPAYKNYE